MADVKFSVGRIKRGDASYVGYLTNATVSHDSNAQDLYAGDYRKPLAIKTGDGSTTITAETADYGVVEPVFGIEETLELEAGPNGGGPVATFTNMVLVSAEIRFTQNGFAATSLEWRQTAGV